MKYEVRLKGVALEVTGDLLSKVEAYRLALFLVDLGRPNPLNNAPWPTLTHHASRMARDSIASLTCA